MNVSALDQVRHIVEVVDNLKDPEVHDFLTEISRQKIDALIKDHAQTIARLFLLNEKDTPVIHRECRPLLIRFMDFCLHTKEVQLCQDAQKAIGEIIEEVSMRFGEQITRYALSGLATQNREPSLNGKLLQIWKKLQEKPGQLTTFADLGISSTDRNDRLRLADNIYKIRDSLQEQNIPHVTITNVRNRGYIYHRLP